jgi:hypothetical protein
MAGFLALIAALGAFVVNIYPDQIVCASVETQRWLKAAFRVEPLPARRSEASEFAPCPANVPSAPTVSMNQYFPPGVLGCNDREEAFVTEWYSRYLRAIREPSLWALSRRQQRTTAYRFLWLRSFQPPVSLRVTINPNWTGVLTTKIGIGARGDGPARLIKDDAFPIGKHGTALLFTRVIETHFWELPSRGTPGGIDGEQWIVEGVQDGLSRCGAVDSCC